jgi:hypothetical protein
VKNLKKVWVKPELDSLEVKNTMFFDWFWPGRGKGHDSDSGDSGNWDSDSKNGFDS